MAIASVEELKGQGRRSGTKNRLWERTYRRTFRVQTTTPHDGPKIVQIATDPGTSVAIPGIGAFYTNGTAAFVQTETDLGSFVEDVQAEEEDIDGLAWIVTVNYGPYPANIFPINPVDWPLKVWYGSQKFETTVDKDWQGEEIANSAFTPFDPPVTIDDSRALIHCQRNELVSTFDEQLPKRYKDHINQADWNGYGRENVKCSEITTSEPQYDTNAQAWYYVVNYTFEIDDNQWAKTLLDQGFMHLDTSTPPQQVALNDKQGQPLTKPVPLDGSGQRLPTTGTPVYLTFDVYPLADFDHLGIDLSTRLGH